MRLEARLYCFAWDTGQPGWAPLLQSISLKKLIGWLSDVQISYMMNKMDHLVHRLQPHSETVRETLFGRWSSSITEKTMSFKRRCEIEHCFGGETLQVTHRARREVKWINPFIMTPGRMTSITCTSKTIESTGIGADFRQKCLLFHSTH